MQQPKKTKKKRVNKLIIVIFIIILKTDGTIGIRPVSTLNFMQLEWNHSALATTPASEVSCQSGKILLHRVMEFTSPVDTHIHAVRKTN